MRPALLQHGVPDVVCLLILQPLAFAEHQAGLAMRVPGGLEAAAGVAALAQREPDAVLDRLQIRRLADPGLAQGRAADHVDARNGLPLLVGGDGYFPVDSHGWALAGGG